MFNTNFAARSRKAPQVDHGDKSAIVRPKAKPGLAVDTSFTQHKGSLPQQVFPRQPRKEEELTFVSVRDVKKSNDACRPSFRQQVEKIIAIRPAAQKSVLESTMSRNGEDKRRSEVPVLAQRTPSLSHSNAKPSIVPVHKSINGLRPAPLDLAQGVSPSDRAITIGVAIPSASYNNHANARSSPRMLGSQQQTYDPTTPTIIITPAKDDFEMNVSPEDMKRSTGYRPASSVYSRFTTYEPSNTQPEGTPPVPPLPFLHGCSKPQASATFNNDADTKELECQTAYAMSKQVRSLKDEVTTPRYPRILKRSVSQTTLNTPRQSKGWWNFITSPFSASSRSHAFFWQSPSLPENDEEEEPIMRDASGMSRSGPHDGVIFTNRASDDEHLRSAPATENRSWTPTLPKRSDTAPGAFCNGEYAVDIYRIPSHGEAAAYYDPNRHFPSLIVDPKDMPLDRDLPPGWSPSQSVYRPEKERQSRVVSSAMPGGFLTMPDHEVGGDEGSRGFSSPQSGPQMASCEPYFDEKANNTEMPPPPANSDRNIFSTPSAQELGSPAMAPSARKNTHPVVQSYFSPLSATPVLEEAHRGTMIGPQTSNADLREVDITSARIPVPTGPLLAAATMTHKEVDPPQAPEPASAAGMMWSEKSPYRPGHVRNESYGLGISDGEEELRKPAETPPKKVMLGIDRFGQLEVRSVDEVHKPRRPWYKRFLWTLISVAAFLLMCVVVLLVILLPQIHKDIAVEAQWVNTTAFPPLPTGVMTVANPNTASVVNGCINPTSLWSCDMPDTQSGPNFRFEIRYRSGILPSNETALTKRAGPAARAGSVVRRDSWSNSLFASVPAPPSQDDQLFIGQSTDNISAPYNGEQTPFYISLLDPVQLEARSLAKRQDSSNPYPYPTTATSNSSASTAPATSSTSASIAPSISIPTNAPTSIPAPALSSSGEAVDAQLYPYLSAQPLRVYNRGQDDEHYGFYSYFDRSILVANLSASVSPGLNPNITTNVTPDNATAVCTFSQTRLHVQIWTRKANVASVGTVIPLSGLRATNSTANDMSASGSFPYAVTVTLDRHGGEADLKGVYCYGIDDGHHVDVSASTWVREDRAFQGVLVNPASVPGSNGTQASKRDSSASTTNGIDGGSGGCQCAWQNWT